MKIANYDCKIIKNIRFYIKNDQIIISASKHLCFEDQIFRHSKYLCFEDKIILTNKTKEAAKTKNDINCEKEICCAGGGCRSLRAYIVLAMPVALARVRSTRLMVQLSCAFVFTIIRHIFFSHEIL